MEDLSSDQLEEGEIVDHDDFEDISDNSIIESTFGKFVSSNENLRALSLSSDSDVEITCKDVKRKKSHPPQRKKKRKRNNKTVYDDSSDSDVSTCSDLKDKLKEAVHINEIDEGRKKPLETRLKGMCWSVTTTTTTANNVVAETDSNEKNSFDKIDDRELEKLRIEALKTAVLNKFQRRKKRKAILEEHNKKNEEPMENKENDTPTADKVDSNSSRPPALDIEEDEDVLRASLLAGLAKKITRVEVNGVKSDDAIQTFPSQGGAPPPRPPMMLRPKLPVFNRRPPKPQQVKPLIININEDSDDDEDEDDKCESGTTKDNDYITSNVEKFLKEQRAKFETTERRKRFQIVHKSILEKSAVKLLPKSQQIEYQQLVKKLKLAEKRKRAMMEALERKPVGGTEEASGTPEAVVEETTTTTNQERKKSGITTELTILQKTLKEIRMQRNGSLQIKKKYQLLTPIIRKITETSNERKKQEQRIKYLLHDLNEARKNLAQSHEKFSSLVRELIGRKEKIDSSCEENLNISVIKKTVPPPNSSFHNSSVEESRENNKLFPVTSTPIILKKGSSTIEAAAASITQDDCEDMDVCYSDETEQIDIVDPNDIDQIFTTRKSSLNNKMSIPEYVSPLNANERYRHVDPHGIMCPYEVNGSCRDTDCTFKHYLKNSGKVQ